MPHNAYLLAKIGADTAENERNFAEDVPKIGNYPTLKRGYGGRGPAAPRGGVARGGPPAQPHAQHAAKLGLVWSNSELD